MPRVNIYISNENYDHWKNLDNKSSFVNNALRYNVGQAVRQAQGAVGGIVQSSASNSSASPPITSHCEHGHSPGFCKQCPKK